MHDLNGNEAVLVDGVWDALVVLGHLIRELHLIEGSVILIELLRDFFAFDFGLDLWLRSILVDSCEVTVN